MKLWKQTKLKKKLKRNRGKMELGKARSTEEIIKDIKSVLESKVKDNVETHGGEIKYKIIWGSTKHKD